MTLKDIREKADEMEDNEYPHCAKVLRALADVVAAAKHVDRYMDEEQWPDLSAALAKLEAIKP